MCVTAYGMQAMMARTFVDDVFGGVLVSTVTCDVCYHVSALVHVCVGYRMLKEKHAYSTYVILYI